MPEKWAAQFEANSKPSYVNLTAAGRGAEFRATVRMGTHTSSQFWVPPGTFGLDNGQITDVTPEPLSGSTYRFHRLTSTGAGLLTLLGLVLAVAGVVISSSLAVGEVWAPLKISSSQQAGMLVVSAILQVGGLTLVLFRRSGLWGQPMGVGQSRPSIASWAA